MSRFSPHQHVVNYNRDGGHDQLMLGVVFMALGETLIVLSGAVIKEVTSEVPIVQVMFFRSLIGLSLLLPLVMRLGYQRLHTQKMMSHFLRAAFGAIAMFCMFYSFNTLKLTEAILIKATSPIILSFLAWVLLRERLSQVSWLAYVLAFVGVVIIVNPSEFDPVLGLGFAAGLFSALSAAFAKIMIRRLGQTESSDVIVFYFMTFVTLFTLPFMIINWQRIVAQTFLEWGLLCLIALFATAGQVCITRAFSLAKTGQVAMFTYLSLPTAGLLGWVIWGESITPPLIMGTIVIVCAGMLCVYVSNTNAVNTRSANL